MLHEQAQSFLVEDLHGPVVLLVELLDEGVDEKRDVLPPLAQRGQVTFSTFRR